MTSRSTLTLLSVLLSVGWPAWAGAGETTATGLLDAFERNAKSWALLGGRLDHSTALQAATEAQWKTEERRIFVTPGAAATFSIAAYTVPSGAAGFYAIEDSLLRRDTAQPGRIDILVYVRRASATQQPPPAVRTQLGAGELFDFDAFLGYLDAGDVVNVAVGPADDPAGDRTEIDFRIVRVPSIPVSVLSEDLNSADRVAAPGGWSIAHGVPTASAARRLAWGRAGDKGLSFTGQGARLSLDHGSQGESLVSFRVPHSGYYALHDAWLKANGGAFEAGIHVGDEDAERRATRVEPAMGQVSFNTDVGYVAKGEVIHIRFKTTSGSPVAAEFGGTMVEWAPRRPPLRVRRGADGYLDVFEPEASRQTVDIPESQWITVAAEAGDATDAIRRAFAAAQNRRSGNGYVGVRLEAQRTYTVASTQVGGTVFSLRDTQRLVLDGNGATIRVASPELARKEVNLFSLARSRNVVFADFVVEATSVPFTTGEILAVSPRGENTQTVTWRVDPGELDPLKDISRDGRNNAYAYDPSIPGRLALGSWTHYPGSGDPSIQSTDTPGVFTHRVTRTNDSIAPGAKWLVKNKRAGVIYLTTRAGTENVTMSGIVGRAAGGGQLRFWQTSGINILDCSFEPDGDNWISSSADGVHGRGREGVWIENTLIRGVCEDIMNTYGQNMIVVADEDLDDNVMAIRMFTRSSESLDDGAPRLPTEESVAVGDQLVFFDPRTGSVQGYAGVTAVADGRYTLTNAVPGIDAWDEGDGKNATMVYNTRVAGRFFVRDSRLMDSMRFGIYIKARGGVVFNTQFEGLSAPGVFATNEPEWPEGPPATHLWVQGCTFSQNNYGYMPRNRDFMVVDPADISIYTRRFRDPAEPDDFRANLTRGEYANSHVKLIGNVFHDWRGMGISVRNSRNARIEDNLFLQPVDDEALRGTLAGDPPLSAGGRGRYAAIFLDSVEGVSVSGNRFHGLPAGDRGMVIAEAVAGLVEAENVASSTAVQGTITLSFDEWFGSSSLAMDANRQSVGEVQLGSGVHRAGRLGAGVHFAGGAPATLSELGESAGAPLSDFGVGVWVKIDERSRERAGVLALGDQRHGLSLAVEAGRWRWSVVQNGRVQSIDLGAALPGLWQHLALRFDGAAHVLRGHVDGMEVGRIEDTNAEFQLPVRRLSLGGEGTQAFHGGVDEIRWTTEKWSEADIAALALRNL